MSKHYLNKKKPNKQVQLEERFRKAQHIMRALRVTNETKELQKDIMWTMDNIERLGFKFFPHHYDVHEEVSKFEAMVRQLQEHETTNRK